VHILSSLRCSQAPFVAVLYALRHAWQVDDAIAVLKLMVASGVRPSLQTRTALCVMAVRMRSARASEAVPSHPSFWQQLPMPLQPTLGALHDVGVSTQAAADLLLEARSAALLESVTELMAQPLTTAASRLGEIGRVPTGADLAAVDVEAPRAEESEPEPAGQEF